MIWNKLKIANKIKLLLVTMVLLVFALLAYTSYAIFSKALIAESDKEMTLTNHYREEQIAELLLESEAYMKDASSVLSAAISLSDQRWETLSGQLHKSGETYYPASLLYNGVSLGQQITGLEAQIKKIQPVFDQPGSSKVGQFVYLEDRLLVPLFFSNNAGDLAIAVIHRAQHIHQFAPGIDFTCFDIWLRDMIQYKGLRRTGSHQFNCGFQLVRHNQDIIGKPILAQLPDASDYFRT